MKIPDKIQNLTNSKKSINCKWDDKYLKSCIRNHNKANYSKYFRQESIVSYINFYYYYDVSKNNASRCIYSVSILKISFNINIFRLRALSIILVVPYHLFYVISRVAEVCLSCEGVEQYREKIECNCYIFNFDRDTHKLTPQSTWLFYRKRPTIYRKDLVLCQKTLY